MTDPGCSQRIRGAGRTRPDKVGYLAQLSVIPFANITTYSGLVRWIRVHRDDFPLLLFRDLTHTVGPTK